MSIEYTIQHDSVHNDFELETIDMYSHNDLILITRSFLNSFITDINSIDIDEENEFIFGLVEEISEEVTPNEPLLHKLDNRIYWLRVRVLGKYAQAMLFSLNGRRKYHHIYKLMNIDDSIKMHACLKTL